jgi:hypothetical protein
MISARNIGFVDFAMFEPGEAYSKAQLSAETKWDITQYTYHKGKTPSRPHDRRISPARDRG